jgi:hypothetical protein
LNKKAKIIAKPKKQQLKAKPIEPKTIQSIDNDDIEVGIIEYSDGLAMVKGIGNQWMVVLHDDINGMESMSEWINKNEAIALIKDLLIAA